MEKCTEVVGTKIENLISSKSILQEEVNSFAKSVKDSSVPLCTADVGANPVAAHVSCTIVDELTEREKQKKNIVIYNLPDGKDRDEDKLSVLSLIESQINRAICLGRRTENKQRPSLVCFELKEDENIVVSHS